MRGAIAYQMLWTTAVWSNDLALPVNAGNDLQGRSWPALVAHLSSLHSRQLYCRSGRPPFCHAGCPGRLRDLGSNMMQSASYEGKRQTIGYSEHLQRGYLVIPPREELFQELLAGLMISVSQAAIFIEEYCPNSGWG